MKRCPECGARIKNRSAVRCPACTAPLPAPRPSVGKHEIQRKSGRKPLIISDRRISPESDNNAKRKRTWTDQNSDEPRSQPVIIQIPNISVSPLLTKIRAAKIFAICEIYASSKSF